MEVDRNIRIIDEVNEKVSQRQIQSALRCPEVHTFAWKMRICIAHMEDNNMRDMRDHY